MEAEFNERIERIQKELQEQLARSQQETRDLMVRLREESLEQKDQMAKMMEMMSALVKGKGPMQSLDIEESRSRVNHNQDPLYPPDSLHYTPAQHKEGTPKENPQTQSNGWCHVLI